MKFVVWAKFPEESVNILFYLTTYFYWIQTPASLFCGKYDDVWIIGGEKLYSEFINDPELNKLVKEVYVTEIAGDYGCDVFFGMLDASQYEETSCECVGEKVKFKVYRNKLWASC